MARIVPSRSEVDGPVLLFDGVCNLCNGAVDLVMRRDGGHFRFAALQSDAGAALLNRAGAPRDYLESFVLVDGETHLVRSDAALAIAKHLGWPWQALGLFRILPRRLRDAVYGTIAARRYRWFGKRETCRIPTADERARFLDGAE